eukprot:TRINITY_DN53249_c0_g1_i1.p1 TRINITY_DN53249_c0_g1~~TRINITY_DN53249_c0_g1_i1.p1  ORF type:complete len:303 (-),score=18.82 TRINITY_DN53249_c0_g1_i1:12-806(-)
MRANLLAANTGANGWRSSGSGIYSFAPPEGDLRRSQQNLYDNSAILEGNGTILVDTVHSPKVWSAESPSTHVSGSESKHDRCENRPMDSALTPLHMGVQQIAQASTNGTHCRAALHPLGSKGGSVNWYLLAASGMYHGLFELELCAIVPCVESDLSCIDSLGDRLPALLVDSNVSVSASFASENTTLAFATRPTGFPVRDSQLLRPNSTAIVVANSVDTLTNNEEGLYAIAVANRIYRAQSACSRQQTRVKEGQRHMSLRGLLV